MTGPLRPVQCSVLSDLRLAILTDVHGNAFALDAVLQDIAQSAPDLTVNLGDQLWGQADPVRALELLQALQAVEVRGNNDERLIAPPTTLPPSLVPLQMWLAERLPQEALTRVASLPTTATLADGLVLAAHGTPTSPWDSLLISWDGASYARRPDHEIRDRLAVPPGTEVVLVGHMHCEDVRDLDGQLLVSVGPVSFQGDGDPRARWALLERRAGRWTVDFRRVRYDWDAAARWERAYGPLAESVDHVSPPVRPMRDQDGHLLPPVQSHIP